MKKLLTSTLAIATAFSISSCGGNNKDKAATPDAIPDSAKRETPVVAVTGQEVKYSDGSTSLVGYVAYDSASVAKRPVVLVVPEWWGLNDYAKSRARQLAELGYLAIAVDYYGNGQQANDPAAAMKLSGPFYKDFSLGKKRFDAALAKIKTYPQADTSKIAAIGYCFGGAQVLNVARQGEHLLGVVSFHGGLVGVTPDKSIEKARILVCHGEADQMVTKEEVAKFKKQMDSVGIAYTFRSYPGAGHAFTNPAATELGKKFNIPVAYNEAADKASWEDMKNFFAEIFK